MTARDYEVVIETILQFEHGARLPLTMRLVGELTVLRGGVAVALPASKKTRALLGYLVATRAPQPR